MKKVIVIVVVVIVLGLGGWLIFGHKSNSSSTSSNTPMPSMDMSSSSSASDQPAQAVNAVTIDNFAFSPAAITVKKGTTVTWTNQDSTEHTVTETDGQAGPKSGSLGKGQSYTFTFNTTGTFHYDCSIHTEMTGTVTVTE